MQIFVQHKAGSPKANKSAILKASWKAFWSRKLDIIVYFDADINYGAAADDWFKIIGWKSGIDTKTNREYILVYRVKLMGRYKIIQFGIYQRPGNKENNQFTVDIIDQYYVPDPNRIKTFQCKLYRPKKCFIPVYPFAGGDDFTKNDFSYLFDAE
jgi:hypothetical protein